MANVTKSGAERQEKLVPADSALTPAAEETLVVRRAQEGDVAAYEILVKTHQHRVLAVAGGILRGSEDVEDVAQQALAKAFFRSSASIFGRHLGPALQDCGKRVLGHHSRKKKVRRLSDESDLSEEQLRKLDAVPESSFGGHRHREDASRRVEQQQILSRLMEELDERDQTMLVMKEVEGFSVRNRGAFGFERKHRKSKTIPSA